MLRTMIPWVERLPRPFGRMEEEMERVMQRFLAPREGEFNGGMAFVPQANIAETEKEFEVTVELPGLKPEEVKVEVKGGAIWVTGERKEEKEEKGKTWHRVERRYGEFRRVFELPTEVKPEKVVARFENGVLKIVLPKVEVPKPVAIEVK